MPIQIALDSLKQAASGTANSATFLRGDNAFSSTFSSNVGIGVTPSAWSSSARALQIGTSISEVGALSVEEVSGMDYLTLSQNAYWDGSTFRYIGSGSNQASAFRQRAGTFEFYSASSGTAGNAITFTALMTLISSGNVGIGTASPSTRLHTLTASGENKLIVEASAASQAATLSLQTNNTTPGQCIVYMGKTGASTNGQVGYEPNYDYLYLFTANTEKMRITSSGNVGIGTSSPRGLFDVVSGTTNTSGDAIGAAVIQGTSHNFGVSGLTTLSIQSNDAQAADKGGSIGFGFRATNSSTVGTVSAAIAGAKENGTTTNTAG